MFGLNVFHLIGMYLDGKDAAFCRRVCKTWKHYVDTGDDLKWKMKSHLVVLTNIDHLRPLLVASRNDDLKLLSPTASNTWFESILWFNHHVNVYDLPLTWSYWGDDSMGMRFVNSIFEMGEGSCGFLQNGRTNELIFVNNYYGDHFSTCRHRENAQVSTCCDIDHKIEKLNSVSKAFPGLISNWKFIHFPFQPDADYNVAGQKFHRASSICITFNPGTLVSAFPIEKNLKKMIKAQPPCNGFVGKGKKRKSIMHDYRRCFEESETMNVMKRVKETVHEMKDAIEGEERKQFKSIPYDRWLGQVSRK